MMMAGFSPRGARQRSGSPPLAPGSPESQRSAGSKLRWNARDASSGQRSPRIKANKITPRSRSAFAFRREGGTSSELATAPNPLQCPPRPPRGTPARSLPLQSEGPEADLEPGLQHLRQLIAEDSRHLVEALALQVEAAQRKLLDAQSAVILEAVAQGGASRQCQDAEEHHGQGSGHRLGHGGDGPAPHGSAPRPARPRSSHGSRCSEQAIGKSSLRNPRGPEPSREGARDRRPPEARCQAASGVPSATQDVNGLDVFSHAKVASASALGELSFSQEARDTSRYHNLIDTTQAVLKCLVHGFPQPEEDRMIYKWVNSWIFTNWCAFVILLNAIFNAASTNYELWYPGEGSTAILHGAESAFVIWYIIELLLKMAAYGRYFFIGQDYKWNVFDILLVSLAAMQVFATPGGASFSFARSIRLGKMLKVFYVFRFLEFFKDARVMMVCMFQSFLAIFWCLMIIAFMLYFVAVVILQAVIIQVESSESVEDKEWLQETFPSVQGTMLVLFESTTGGRDWGGPLADIGETEQVWAQAVFLCYIAFFTIAVWNVVAAVFIEKAMSLTEPDKEEFMIRQRRAELQEIEELKKLFSEMDIDHSKTISIAEFQDVWKVPEFKYFLDRRGIHIKEAGALFSMIAQSTGADVEIDIGTMVACLLRAKGMATSLDLYTLRFEMKSALRKQRQVLDDVRMCLSHAGAGVAEPCNTVAAGAPARCARAPNTGDA